MQKTKQQPTTYGTQPRGAARKEIFDVVTFDCYGTLVDWDEGIREAFERAMAGDKEAPSVRWTEIIDSYEEEEKRVEKMEPYRPYREVLARAALGVAKRIGWNLSNAQACFLAASLPRWKPFPDTNLALERIAVSHELGILSNVDNDLLASTLIQFTVPFDLIVTAEQVKSYKPRTKHFEVARKRIGKDKRWLHVAGSIYHDVEPAVKLGIPVAWVNRNRISDKFSDEGKPVKVVKNLTDLADWLESVWSK